MKTTVMKTTASFILSLIMITVVQAQQKLADNTINFAPTTRDVSESIEVSISMVTVDTSLAVAKNLIVWEKPVTETIDHFNIYKEDTTDYYVLIASQPYAEEGTFLDTASSPDLHSDRYKISSVDTSGNESALSPYHQTMFLGQCMGIEDSTLLIVWNIYEDESGNYTPTAYNIYRGTDPDNMTLEANLVSPLVSYYYSLTDVVSNEIFIVSCDLSNSNLRTDSESYFTSLSNVISAGAMNTHVKKIETNWFRVYPNPAKNNIRIQSDENIDRIRLFDIGGKMVLNQKINLVNEVKLDISAFNKGLYLLEVNGQKEKLVIQ